MSSLIRRKSWPDLKSAREDLDGSDANYQIVRKVKEDMLEIKNEMNELKKGYDSLSEENKRLQRVLDKLKERTEENSSLVLEMISEANQSFESFEGVTKDTDELWDEIDVVNQRISILNFKTLRKIGSLEMELIENDLVVEGLENSDLMSSVMAMGRVIECPISPSDIKMCIRAPTQEVIVKFIHWEKRKEFLLKASINTKLFHNHKVLVRERLTHYKEMLLRAAKQFIKSPSNPKGTYMKAWSENGMVYMQKSKKSKIILINSLKDLPKENPKQNRRRRN